MTAAMKNLFSVLCIIYLLQKNESLQLGDLIKQSSTVSMSDIYLTYGPQFAIDGIYPNAEFETPERCNCCSIAQGSGTYWWTIDFGYPQMIAAITITGRRNLRDQYQSKDLQVYTSNINVTQVDGWFGDMVWYINTTTPGYIFSHTFEPPNNFQYLSITRQSSIYSHMTICEVDFVTTGDLIKQSSTVSMSDTYFSYGPQFAIDGRYPNAEFETPERCNCCSITQGSGTHWWTIDFGYPRMISGITITGRRNLWFQYQSKDLNIYTSNTNVTQEDGWFGDMVWYINTTTPGYIFSHTFEPPRNFQYLSIIRQSTMYSHMTICEVDLFTTDCSSGFFGSNCSETCGHCQNSTSCLVTNGTCPDGCAPGYDVNDTTCKTNCSTGQYGAECQESCGNCIIGSSCWHVDGTCPAGCAPGYNYTADRKCKTECQDGFYGNNCSETCGQCLDGTTACMVTNGTCPAGCAYGYYTSDETCKTNCSPGFFGSNCSETCGHCQNSTSCLVTNGTCPDGCAPGYDVNDTTCKTNCSTGQYGAECQESCGNCIIGFSCWHVDGMCPAGCAPGYNYTADRKCNTECQDGFYGNNCSETCGQCLDGTTACMVTNGTCPAGCAYGYYTSDETCKTECQPGEYGLNCSETCGQCIGGANNCSVTDGMCPAGCAQGYDYTADRKCNTECQSGLYGNNCSETCGQCLDGTSACMFTNGTCPAGCAHGYYASDKTCKTECPDGTYGPDCSKLCGHCSGRPGWCLKADGTCLSGHCLKGYTGPTCHQEVNILQLAADVLHTLQSSQFGDRDSKLAVDGARGPDPEHCGCCSQTQNNEISWWQVDMGVTVPIREIVVYGRQDDDRYQQLSGFSVYLSTSGQFSDGSFVPVPKSEFNVTYYIDVDGRYARYVRIQRPGVLTICEVEVFQSEKTCPNNTFSLKCLACGHCKDRLPCDMITGQCENGCHEGYTGELCTLPVLVKSDVGLLVGSALGGAVVVLVAVGVVVWLRRTRLMCLQKCRISGDYESHKQTFDANDQNMYQTIDKLDRPVSEESISTSRHYENTMF